jgi:tetratricopeptide (TPR) repeat protein
MFRIKKILELFFRGYGQLFLCNRVQSGLIFLLAFLILSPYHAFLSLVGGMTVTVFSILLKPPRSLLQSGIFGVNGVLLGLFWSIYPEIGYGTALIATVVGSSLLAPVLVGINRRLHRGSTAITVFTLPAVIFFWLLLLSLWGLDRYDPALTAGWKSYHNQDLLAADTYFRSAEKNQNLLVQVQSLDGLGWTAFQKGNYHLAAGNFEYAINLDPGFSDAYDGIAWCYFKLGLLTEAVDYFEQSLVHDPLKGSSYDGLGWCSLLAGDTKTARSYFVKAAILTPFFSDPWTGMIRCAVVDKRDPGSCIAVQKLLDDLAGTALMLLPLSHLLAWILFLVGIFVHSRISVAVLLSGIMLVAMARQFPWFDYPLDINFYYNIAAVLIALGGSYIALSPMLLAFMVPLLLSFQLSWPFWQSILPSFLPPLCLPFNLFVILSLLLVLIGGSRSGLQLVPFEVAMSTAEDVVWWKRKNRLLKKCWLMLDNRD